MRHGRAGVTIALIAAQLGFGCDLSTPAVPVPRADLRFPIAAAVIDEDPENAFLVVVSRNLNAKYSSDSLQSWNLGAINAAIDAERSATGCGAIDRAPCAIP